MFLPIVRYRTHAGFVPGDVPSLTRVVTGCKRMVCGPQKYDWHGGKIRVLRVTLSIKPFLASIQKSKNLYCVNPLPIIESGRDRFAMWS